MKKNSGFTIVEIIVSFALAMVIVLFLFQIVLMLKQVYNNNVIASDLVLKQSNISQMINNDLLNNSLGDVLSLDKKSFGVNGSCYDITFSYGTRELCYDNSEKIMSYNDYEFQLVDRSEIHNVDVYISNSMLFIKVPISYPDLDDDYGIRIIY